MKKAVLRIVVCVALTAFAVIGFAQAEGENQDKPADSDWVSRTAQTCASCHGKNGVSQTANFPTLAGQHQDYLLHSLKAYRDGARENAIMGGQVQGMTDAQFKALAQYYSEQSTGPLHTPRVE